jgi:hypothetical protein
MTIRRALRKMPSPNHLPSIGCPLHIVEVWPERFAVRREFVGIAVRTIVR